MSEAKKDESDLSALLGAERTGNTMNIDAAKNLLNEVNAMILLPDEPLEGDFIALDWDEQHPADFKQGISWYCSQVIEVDGNKYKVSYDDGARWYEFKEFGTPKPSDKGAYNIYPALAPIGT
jgi:hypothetical protein